MKILFPIIVSLTLLSQMVLKAQHCQFDLVRVIVLSVYADSDTNIVPNLKITLLDSLGNTIFTNWDSKADVDTLKFWRNVKGGGKDKVENRNPWWNPNTYWFANNNYLIVGGEWLLKQSRKIKIEDGEDNGGYFETKTVDLAETDLYPLCTGRSHWTKGEKYGFVEGFKPIEVRLKKK